LRSEEGTSFPPADEPCLLPELALFFDYTSTVNHRNAQARCTNAK
jgi:hypothetical protein